MGQLLITETEKRDYLRFAFYARKQYRDNWIQRIETELQDQTLNKKAINKKMTALEAWKNLHPVIERYPDEIMNTWEELPLNELWKTIKADRDLADVLLNGLWRMKLNIEEGREFQCLQKLDYEIVKKETENITCGFVAGKDARDVKAWEVLQQLEDSLHSLFRPVEDQQQTTAPATEIITDNRQKLSDEVFEKELLPRIFEKLENGKFKTSKTELYRQIAEPYDFGGSIIKKRFEKDYKPFFEKIYNAFIRYDCVPPTKSQLNRLR